MTQDWKAKVQQAGKAAGLSDKELATLALTPRQALRLASELVKLMSPEEKAQFRANLTTEQLGEILLENVKQMSPQEKEKFLRQVDIDMKKETR